MKSVAMLAFVIHACSLALPSIIMVSVVDFAKESFLTISVQANKTEKKK
jgi:hypothetical protein